MWGGLLSEGARIGKAARFVNVQPGEIRAIARASWRDAASREGRQEIGMSSAVKSRAVILAGNVGAVARLYQGRAPASIEKG